MMAENNNNHACMHFIGVAAFMSFVLNSSLQPMCHSDSDLLTL